MQPLTPFVELLTKANRLSRIVGVCIALFGGALYLIPAKSERDTMIKLAIMGLFILLGIVLFAMGFQDPEKNKALVALRETPKDIVWVYVQRNHRNGVHVGSQLMLAHVGGKMLPLPLKLGQEDELRGLVLARVPHAHVGYDPELEARFKNAPDSLQR